jgi:hypothetical protein
MSSATSPLGRFVNALATRERYALTAGSVICGLATLWLARVLRVPADVGSAGTVLQQQGMAVALGLIWLVMIAGAILASVVTLKLHYDAGLFCAGISVVALSVRFGPSRYALLTSDSPGIYLTMAGELILLFIGLALAWAILRLGARSGLLPEEPSMDPHEPDAPLDQKLIALAAQVVLTMVGMLLLCQSDAKPQVLASLAISCYFATIGAHHFITTHPSIWYWPGPMIVGVIGYTMQYFNPGEWMIGDARGFFAPLARPLPLDYAGMGAAASLLGYWTSKRWRAGQIDDVEEPA